MKEVLKSRGPIYNGWILLSNLMILNLLFVACSIPILTLGASLSSLYKTTITLSADEFTSVSQEFFSNFKDSFYRGTKIFFLLFLSNFIIIFLLYFSSVIKIVFLTFFFLFLFSNFLLLKFIVFPIGALYEGNYKVVLRNATLFLHSHLVISIFIFFISIIFYIIVPIFIPRFIILHLLVGFSGMAFFQVKIIKKESYRK